MDVSLEDARWKEIRMTHKTYKAFYQVMGGSALVALGIFLGMLFFADGQGYSMNLYTELISIGVTIFVLDRMAEHREKQRLTADLKRELINQLGSSINHETRRAAERLRYFDWLFDGSLENAILWEANLQAANLWESNLRRCNLNLANLESAELVSAELQDATLIGANLQGANLLFADLSSCVMRGASLCGANLCGSNLRGADLSGADLRQAILHRSEFNEDTTLPDGTKWAQSTDMALFTSASP